MDLSTVWFASVPSPCDHVANQRSFSLRGSRAGIPANPSLRRALRAHTALLLRGRGFKKRKAVYVFKIPFESLCRKHESKNRPEAYFHFHKFPGRDSNPDSEIQSLLSCR